MEFVKSIFEASPIIALFLCVAVALVLSLPFNEFKPVLLTITYAIVLFSIIVQGLTIKPLVGKVVR